MGKNGKWFSSVKKALSPESKEKKAEKSKKKWFGKGKSTVPDHEATPHNENPPTDLHHPPPPPPPLALEEMKMVKVEDEQTKHAYSVAVATAAAAEAAAAAAQAAAEVVRLTAAVQFPGKSKEEVAAIRIQTAFRGYLARRALRALRGLVRLQKLVESPTVKRQTASALKCMQNVGRIQAQIQARRMRMLEENQALQRQLLQKRAKEESLQTGENWDDSVQSKEQVEASLLNKYEAALRRERALAYSYSHQQTWKKSARPAILMFMDPNNPHWGWSWLERWMEDRSSEPKPVSNEKESNTITDTTSAGEITKAFARHQLNNSSKPTLSTPQSKPIRPLLPRKPKSASPRGGKPVTGREDEDARSVLSVQSERNRRHSIAGSSVRDDESLASSPSFPSYMAPTQSVKAKLRLQSPLGLENGSSEISPSPSVVSAKKRLAFPASPARPRRLSGPPRIESNTNAENSKAPGLDVTA